MKIRRVTATPINFPLEAPYGWVFGELPGFSQTIIEVETDEGIVGLGEASGAGAASPSGPAWRTCLQKKWCRVSLAA